MEEVMIEKGFIFHITSLQGFVLINTKTQGDSRKCGISYVAPSGL